jgi:hypothetical protein
MREGRYWPNQPRGGRAEEGLTGRLRDGSAISNEMPVAEQGGRWIGIWSPHPVVNNLLCFAFRRSRRLRELVTRAESISLDCQSYTQHPFLIILDMLPLTLEETAASVRRAMAEFPQSKLIGLVDPRRVDIIQLLRLGLSASFRRRRTLKLTSPSPSPQFTEDLSGCQNLCCSNRRHVCNRSSIVSWLPMRC